MPEIFVDRGSDLRTIERGVKNQFRWFWLDEKDGDGEVQGNYVKKIAEPGVAYCLYCRQRLYYASKGKTLIPRHARSKRHQTTRGEVATNYSLPATFQTVRNLESGAASCAPNENVIDTASTSAAPLPVASPSMRDRIAHQEATICSFIAENSLPLTMAPKLIGLAQLLAKDSNALQSLKMERKTPTYNKLRFGLAEVLRKRLVLKLRSSFFSINLEESTTTTKHGKKRILILNILVCYFDLEVGKSVTHLYSCVELSTVDAVNVYEALMDTLKSDRIPLSNIISVLSDSAAYMRGKPNGFFGKFKSAAPHIIDIDAARHDAHNISKSFSASVDPDNHVAELLDDVFTDLESSADLREEFLSLCDLLNVKCVLPKERGAGPRWFSLLDCCLSFHELKDVVCVFYYSWLSQEDTELFKLKVNDILINKKVSKVDRQRVFGIMKRVRSKNVTDMGKARKSRICHKLFDLEHKTFLLVGIFLSVFPIFKKFLLLFERKTPMLHVLHDEQVDMFRNFLKFFVRSEFIWDSGKQLNRLDLSKKEHIFPAAHIFVGSCSQVLLKMNDGDVKSFRSRLLDSYLSTAIYMQKKLPLENSLLKTFSFLDPKLFGKGLTYIALKRLPKFFPTVDVGNFDSEIMLMQTDVDISADDNCQLDVWWARVFKLNRYPSVRNIVSACLSVFTGPRVEEQMNVVISHETKSSLLVHTYEAYMFPKYHLLSLESSTLKFYDRENSVTPVDSSLAYHMETAASRNSNSKGKKRASEDIGSPLDLPAKKRN